MGQKKNGLVHQGQAIPRQMKYDIVCTPHDAYAAAYSF